MCSGRRWWTPVATDYTIATATATTATTTSRATSDGGGKKWVEGQVDIPGDMMTTTSTAVAARRRALLQTSVDATSIGLIWYRCDINKYIIHMYYVYINAIVPPPPRCPLDYPAMEVTGDYDFHAEIPL